MRTILDKSLILNKRQQVAFPGYVKYLGAVLATIACLYGQILLKPIFGPMQYFLLFPLVFVVSALGGLGPALVVICIGGIGSTRFLIDPMIYMNMPNQSLLSFVKFLIFGFTTLAGSWIVHKIQSNQQSLLNDIDILKESDKQFKMLGDSSPVLIWMTNHEKKNTWFNQSWLKFVGMTLDQAIDFNMDEYIHPEDVESMMRLFNSSVDKRKEFRHEYRLKKILGDGKFEYRWLLCNAVPMSSNNEFIGYLGTCVDIHDDKIAEDKIKKALQSRDQFLAVASHELKTPITSLTLQAQVFMRMIEKNDEIPKEKALIIAEQINRQVFRLDRLIDDMLDNSRINSGKFQIYPEEMNLCELSEEVIEKIKKQFSNKKDGIPMISYSNTSGDRSKATGVWDKIKIEQVITNLLTNAIKYGNKSPIEVRVTPAEDKITLSVTDQGIGISPENINKIFNRFHQVGNMSTSTSNGLGLGLFISKQIVKSHQGKIWVDSVFGKGSTFYVELPKFTQEASEDYNG